MSALVLDGTSAKTLPALDKLFRDNATSDKVSEIISKTEGEPLLRLTLAALSRHTMLGEELPESSGNITKLVELLIEENLVAKNGDNVRRTLEYIGEDAQKLILAHSIARYNVYDNQSLGMTR